MICWFAWPIGAVHDQGNTWTKPSRTHEMSRQTWIHMRFAIDWGGNMFRHSIMSCVYCVYIHICIHMFYSIKLSMLLGRKRWSSFRSPDMCHVWNLGNTSEWPSEWGITNWPWDFDPHSHQGCDWLWPPRSFGSEGRRMVTYNSWCTPFTFLHSHKQQRTLKKIYSCSALWGVDGSTGVGHSLQSPRVVYSKARWRLPWR